MKIPKNPKEKAIKWFNWVSTILLIVGIIFLQMNGLLVKHVKTETCMGVATKCTGDEEICQKIIQRS